MRSLALLALFGLSAAAGLPDTARTIPALHGVVLTGDKVELPEALKGRVGVLVVGFSQGSREEVTNWGKRLSADYRDSNGVLYYEMPVLAAVPRFLRGIVLGKIKDNVPDRAKGRLLPVVDHEAEWKVAAGFGKAEDAYVLVVDSAGTVRWRTQGAISDAGYGEVRRQVDGLRATAH